MARRSDDDDAMVRQCDGDGALLLVRWYDVDEAMLYRAIVIHHRTIIIASSLHCVIDFFAQSLFLRKWR